jgi:hypothetical protein
MLDVNHATLLAIKYRWTYCGDVNADRQESKPSLRSESDAVQDERKNKNAFKLPQ